MSENLQLANDLKNTLVSAARVVNDNFGKDVSELGTEYKPQDGDTARTVIDRQCSRIMQSSLLSEYPQAVYNLEETDIEVSDESLEGKLLIFGDPFDGTANAQPRLPLSTQGLIAAQGDQFIAAAALHPFEKHVLYGARGIGVFRQELKIDGNEDYHLDNDPERLPSLEEVFQRLKSGEEILMPFVDAHYTPINFVAQRKTKWKGLFVNTFDKRLGGDYKNAAMMREMGSNIDACMKLAEGRLHCQLTDTIGGIYDVAVGAVFMPELGGKMTDMYETPLQVPKTTAEMKTTPQQVVIASVHPELHAPLAEITRQCYGEGAELYFPGKVGKGELGVVPKYTGFKEWDEANKAVFNSLNKQ